MKSVKISIDVPDIDAGVEFYTKGLGFAGPWSGPHDSVLLSAGDLQVCLLRRTVGSVAVSGSNITRSYDRHWTPVHLDVMVENLADALGQAIAAGARQEGETYANGRFSIAFCSDPFGNGFCLGEEHASEQER